MSEAKLMKLKRQLQLINETVSNDVYNLGGQFFERIVVKLNEVLGADYAFVGKLTEEMTKVETLALVNKEGIIDNFIYELKDTPCANVIGQNPCSYASNVAMLFPKDQLLIDMGIEAYVGVPLYDSRRDPTGILVCLYKNKIKDVFAIESILMIFASRAGAELEHMKLYASLEKHKQELEVKVAERTNELNQRNDELALSNEQLANTLQNLQNAQTQLVQSEKMASLGVLTSGVAHEINNPLNYLMGAYLGLVNYFDAYPSGDKPTTDILLDSIHVGIERISNIVSGLNQFSRNNERMDEACDVHSILDNCLAMLFSQIKNMAEIVKDYSAHPVCVNGNAGKLHQVFLNILTNAVQAIAHSGQIEIITRIKSKKAYIEISDNGIGIDKRIIDKVTDPFFTTKPPGEGTGLGLSIAHSIIKEHQGIFKFESEPNKGTRVIIALPVKDN